MTYILGVDPGVVSGYALLSPAGKPIAWGQTGTGSRRGAPVDITAALSECRAVMRPVSAFDVVLAVEGQFVPSKAGQGQSDRHKAVAILKTSQSAGMWIGIAGAKGAALFDPDGIQPSVWRAAVWGGRWTTAQAKRHAVEMAAHTWGIRVLRTHHHTAEAMWIASYAWGELRAKARQEGIGW